MNGEQTAVASDIDGALIARFLAGDRSAFDTLFYKYQDYVYNIVHGIVGPSGGGARHHAGGLRAGPPLSPVVSARVALRDLLYRIAVNRAVDAARAAKGWRWLPLNEMLRSKPDPEANPAQSVERQAEQEAVQQALMQVPVKHRDVLALRYYQNMSIEEIAEVLGCSVAAAKVRLHRARQHFKERYVSTYGQEGKGS